MGYKNPKEKSSPYWQISYTRNIRSQSDYVRADCVPDIRKQIAAYKFSPHFLSKQPI